MSKIDADSSILFLDEIQEAPDIFAKLRWFYEELRGLPVVAAGSLLEFILSDASCKMPVGRITYLHLEPFSFEEFLKAQNGDDLLSYLQEIEPPFTMPSAIHIRLRDCFNQYIQVGGMPAAISAWIQDESIETIQQDLLATYRDDFFKYKGRIDVNKLDILLRSVFMQLGEKFVYSKADLHIQASAAKQILSLFNKARLCHAVKNSSGNNPALEAEVKEKSFKQIFLDVGLVNRFLGLSKKIEGGIAEQVVGQMLRCLFPFYKEPALYYWHREEKNSSAEVDYLITHKNHVVPIEVKSGSTGSLKSLHVFMKEKNLSFAVRINNDLPSVTSVKHADISYTLLSLPFYLTGQIHRLLDYLTLED